MVAWAYIILVFLGRAEPKKKDWKIYPQEQRSSVLGRGAGLSFQLAASPAVTTDALPRLQVGLRHLSVWFQPHCLLAAATAKAQNRLSIVPAA